MWLIRSIIILVGVIAFLWIGMNNASQNVDFNLFAKNYVNVPLVIFMLIVFAVGMVFSFLIFVFSELKLRHVIARNQKDIARLERELSALRNLPLDDAEPTSQETPVSL